MPKITNTEVLAADDGGDVTLTHNWGADDRLTIATSGAVTLTGDEVRALAERLLAAVKPAGPVMRSRGDSEPWPTRRTGPGECGDVHVLNLRRIGGADIEARCTLQPGHSGPHRGAGHDWPQIMQVRCGNVKYWPGPLSNDPDRRTVCDRDAGHKTPHSGVDQNNTRYDWLRGADCEAGLPGADLVCKLTSGHSGSHQCGTRSWTNRLQP